MPQICQIVRTPSLMSVWWFWIPLSSSYPQRTWDALSVRRGVSLRGVSVLGQSERRREACGRDSSSHSTLSQLQHAFVQTQKSDCRSFTEVHSHVTHQMCLLKADSGRVARVRRLQLGVFLTHNAAFGNWMCVSCTLVVWSSNRESKVSGGRGRIFFFSWTGSLPVSPEYDCCHVQWGDICTCWLTERRERRLCYSSSSSSLDIYGEGLLLSALELLAAEATPRVLNSPTWIAREDTLNLIWMPLQGVCWFLCCRQGFSLLGRDYGEKEEEESFELRNKEDLTPNGRVRTLHLHCTGAHVHEYFIHTSSLNVLKCWDCNNPWNRFSFRKHNHNFMQTDMVTVFGYFKNSRYGFGFMIIKVPLQCYTCYLLAGNHHLLPCKPL